LLFLQEIISHHLASPAGMLDSRHHPDHNSSGFCLARSLLIRMLLIDSDILL
jgi:hypothetical protein